jgi:hypothetical protein
VFARSTTLHARPGFISAGIAFFTEEILPMLRRLDGFVGESLVVDRDTGLCVLTESWASAEAGHASAARVRPQCARVAAVMGSAASEIEEWDIAVMHRDHYALPGACVRATWSRFDPAGCDRVVEAYKASVLPRLVALDGFCSASLMLDRAAGRAASTVTFDSREAMQSSRARAVGSRAAASKELGAELLEVHEFDLALGHLHVPEMV